MKTDNDSAVLLIHGFLGSPDFFTQFTDHIPQNYDVYKILLHGHGGSVTDFANSSMEMWKNQVEATIRKLSEKYRKIVIIAHSMGTFFAMNAASNFHDTVKGIFLLGVPLKIFVRPSYFINGIKLIFDIFEEGDSTAGIIRNALGVNLNKHIWEYKGWIPRGYEVVRESKKVRKLIKNLETPCMIFQSENDEVVSDKSLEYIPHKENIKINVLRDSTHFIYGKNDYIKICTSLEDFLR